MLEASFDVTPHGELQGVLPGRNPESFLPAGTPGRISRTENSSLREPEPSAISIAHLLSEPSRSDNLRGRCRWITDQNLGCRRRNPGGSTLEDTLVECDVNVSLGGRVTMWRLGGFAFDSQPRYGQLDGVSGSRSAENLFAVSSPELRLRSSRCRR